MGGGGVRAQIAAQAASVGIGNSFIEDDDVTITLWPCNLRAWQLWLLVEDQCQTDINGAGSFAAEGAAAIMQDFVPSRKKREKLWPLLLACAAETARLRARDQRG